MTRALSLVLLVLFYAAAGLPAASADDSTPQSVASTHGLLRSWTMQIALDRSRSRVQSVILDHGAVFVQTDAAVIHALDAETGRPIWDGPRLVGDPRHPTLPPAASKNMLAVVNGVRLYLLNRANGELLWQTEINGVPAVGPTMNDENVLVPTINGQVLLFHLKRPEEANGKPKGKPAPAAVTAAEAEAGPPVFRLAANQRPPLGCQTPGQLTAPPIMLTSAEDGDLMAWSTDEGALIIAALELEGKRFVVRHRFLAGNGTAAGLAYRPPEGQGPNDAGLVYVASREGLVYAVNEKTGESVWEFPAGDAVAEGPVLVGPNVYVATQLGGMFCLDAKTGAVRWSAPQVARFLAAGPQRTYGVDKLNRLVSLDPRTGSRLDEMDLHAFPLRLVNAQSDRIYVGTTQGLVQCLQDPHQAQALAYVTDAKHAGKKVDKEKGAAKKIAERPKTEHAKTEHAAKPKAAKKAEGVTMVEEDGEKKPKAAKKKKAKKGEDAGAAADPFAKPVGGKKKK